MAPAAVALVPARAGSERVAHKNVKPLAGHPLIAYTIAAARLSGRFDAIVVSTDSEEIAEVASRYGAEVPGLRPGEMATGTSSDIEWVRYTLELLGDAGRDYGLFSILRPTSPFRGPHTIVRGFDLLLRHGEDADSVRAVERCRQHPGKMWTMDGAFMRPLLPQPEGVPLHSRQYKALPEVFVQDSSLEIAWTRVVTEDDDIAGRRIVPLVSEGVEGFSIDYPDDWERAERLAATGEGTLPEVEAPAESPAPR